MFAIERFRGPRSELLSLFQEADDSTKAIESYMEGGEVLVARNRQGRIIGHVQLIAAAAEWEIKSLAVLSMWRGQRIGSALVRAALEHAFSRGAVCVIVATATADAGNIRFYQRLGFRMNRVEPDAFTAEGGYPVSSVDGIPLRDRVWFSIHDDSGKTRAGNKSGPREVILSDGNHAN